MTDEIRQITKRLVEKARTQSMVEKRVPGAPLTPQEKQQRIDAANSPNRRRKFRGRSGATGEASPLQSRYKNFEEFKDYAETYGLHTRLGFKTPKGAWMSNPMVGSTVEPSDFRRIRRKSLVEKREFSEDKREKLAEENKALPDGSFPIENAKDLSNAIRAVNRAKSPAKAKAHVIKMAKKLGLVDELPENWVHKSSVSR